MLKKTVSLFLVLCLVPFLLVGCENDTEHKKPSSTSSVSKLEVVEAPIDMTNVKPGDDIPFNINEAWCWDWNDLHDYFEDASRSGVQASFDSSKGEYIKLFMPDNITEVDKFDADIIDGMVVVKYDNSKNVINRFIITVVKCQDDTKSHMISTASSETASGESSVAASENEKVSGDLASNEVEKQTIVLWDNTSDKKLSAAVKKYNQNNKKYEIELVSNGTKNGQTTIPQLKYAKVKNNMPDIVFMNSRDIVYAGSIGLVSDISSLGAGQLLWQFTEASFESLCVGSTVYGLPMDGSVSCLATNLDITLKYPEDFSQITSIGDEIAVDLPKGYYPLGINTDTTNSEIVSEFSSWVWRMNGEMFSSDSKKATFNSDEGVRALEMMASLVKDGYAGSASEIFSGKIAYAPVNSTSFDSAFGRYAKQNFGASLLPVLSEDVLPYSCMSTNGYALTCNAFGADGKDTDRARAAYDFVKSLCISSEYQIDRAQKSNSLPTLISAQNSKEFSDQAYVVFIKQFNIAKYLPGIPGYSVIESFISDAVRSVISGEKTAKQALDIAAEKTNARIARG